MHHKKLLLVAASLAIIGACAKVEVDPKGIKDAAAEIRGAAKELPRDILGHDAVRNDTNEINKLKNEIKELKEKLPKPRQYSEIGLSGGGTALFAGGDDFKDTPIPDGATVVGVVVKHEGVVNGLQLVYGLDGREYRMPMHGGNAGREEMFRLESDEYLSGISGKTGTGLDSIVFHTNKRQSQQFGCNGGTDPFNFITPGGVEIAGFYGKARDVIVTKIGIITRTR